MTWKVKFFQSARGDFPVKKFIESQNDKTLSKIIRYVELLQNYGPFLKPPYIQKIADKIYELRITGEISVRIFYTIQNNEYYLLHAFIKKSQKTPIKEIKIAVDRMKEII